jgi:hypothetical protein
MRRGLRIAWVLGTVVLAQLFFVAVGRAQTEGSCVIQVNRTDAGAHAEPGTAYNVDVHDSLQIVVASPDPITHARVQLQFGPLRVPLTDEDVQPSPAWIARYDVSDAATLGVGLYRVEASAQLASGGSCTGAMWFDVTGRSPFTTVAGVAGTLVALVGLVVAIGAMRRAAQGEGGIGQAAIGGALAGIGALVVAQQSGMVPIDGDSVMVWIAAPGLGSAALQQVIGRIGGRAVEAPGSPGRGPASENVGGDQSVGRPPPPAERERPPAAPPPSTAAPTTVSPPAAPGAAVPPPEPARESPSPRTATGASVPPDPEREPHLRDDALDAAAPTTAIPRAAPGDSAPPDETMPPPPPPASAPGIPHGARFPSRRGRRWGRKKSVEGKAAKREPTGATATETGQVAPPRSAYARLDCPDVVVRDVEFELVVGLAATQTEGVVGDELRLPPSVTGPYTMTIQVVADGFDLRASESWRVELSVTGADPYPIATLHLTGRAGNETVAPRAIRAIYSVLGQTLGMAFRPIVVVRNLELVGEQEVEQQEPGVDLSVPTSWRAPDITVRIVEGESENGRLLWTFETPWHDVGIPDEPVASSIGDGEEPRAFTRRLVDAVNAREGKPGLYQYLIGVARSIADEMPERFWELWSEVAKRTIGRPPSILFLSEEPYIPWELAETRPVIDTAAPPFLSAQAAVGRWVLGHRRPPLPPPMEAAISPMAVIWGVYNRPGWNRLVKAEEEAATFGDTYGAVTVNAAADDVLKCLEGTPPADLMHFAVHGIYDPTGTQDGLVLTDGHILDPLQVKGSTFAGTPFVFLNACQVGNGNRILGDYAGLAEAFLYSGAAGVVAPLWSVQDTIAKELALYFYDNAFRGEGVGEVLRRQRALFTKSDDPISATYLAYQYFGHPQMRLTRVVRKEEGGPPRNSTPTETRSASATS